MNEEMRSYILILNKFTYNQITGELINNNTGRQNAPGAGGRYLQVTYKGEHMYVHRFVWMMFNDWRS